MKPSPRSLLLLPLLLLAACAGPKPAAGPVQPAVATPPVHAPVFAAGMQAFDGGDYASARDDFQAAVKSNPDDYLALWELGQTCEKLGDGSAAAIAYRAELRVKPDADAAIAQLANLYTAEGRVEDALALATHGLASVPGSAPLHAAVGNALATRGDATRGDQDAAINQYVQAVEREPTNSLLQYSFAVWLNRWHIRGAAAHLDAARDLGKNDYPMTVSIGHEYRLAGELESCVKVFDGLLAKTDHAEPRTERALCKLGLKDEQGALKDLRAAVAGEPGYPQAHFFLAGRLATARRFADAAAEYRAYLQLAPEGSLASQATERLKLAEEASATRDAPIATAKPAKR
jgi:Tfp pilus assembly protein PilF